MRPEQMFDKWWNGDDPPGTDPPSPRQSAALADWMAATRATARRCAEICDHEDSAQDCAAAIRKEFGL